MEFNEKDLVKYKIEALDNNDNDITIIKQGIIYKKNKCLRTQRFFYEIDKTKLSSFIVYHEDILRKLTFLELVLYNVKAGVKYLASR